MACFYEGDNPANKEEGTPTTDEFFLLMDGSKSTMESGLHPGIFLEVVRNGLPEGYSGYGPKHGGLAEVESVRVDSIPPDTHRGEANTYDNSMESTRYARFVFGPRPFWRDGKVERVPVAFTNFYDETVIRKSTGRFVRTISNFDSRDELGGPETKTARYNGRCFVLKRSLVTHGIRAHFK
jgi:hypothetical protein